MSIVLNECEWAEEAIKNRSLGKKPSETLGRVAKYYINKGYSKKNTHRALEDFIKQCDPYASLPKWDNMIRYVISKATKYGVIEIDSISVTDKELKTIGSLPGRPIKRLAFTLLCLAKYWDAVSSNNNHWVLNKDSEILNLANIRAPLKAQSSLYSKLNKLGLIQFSKAVDNTNVKVCFIEDGEVKMNLCDFRDLGYQYLMYIGEPYYACESCGVISKSKVKKDAPGRPPKYCPGCAAEIKARQDTEAKARYVDNKNRHF